MVQASLKAGITLSLERHLRFREGRRLPLTALTCGVVTQEGCFYTTPANVSMTRDAAQGCPGNRFFFDSTYVVDRLFQVDCAENFDDIFISHLGEILEELPDCVEVSRYF